MTAAMVTKGPRWTASHALSADLGGQCSLCVVQGCICIGRNNCPIGTLYPGPVSEAMIAPAHDQLHRPHAGMGCKPGLLKLQGSCLWHSAWVQPG